MDYKGEWGGGGPGHSWALKWHEKRVPFGPNVNEENPRPILLCGAHTVVLYCDIDFNWLGQVFFFWGGGDLTPPWRSGE
jgi:hypothetical protein